MMMNNHSQILILDDELDICYLLSNFLKKHYPKVDAIHTLESLSKVNIHDYHILFIDNNLIDGSGFDKIPEIKTKNPKLKIIAISAFDTSAERSVAIENGATIFVGKPFQQDEILKVLSQLNESSYEI